MAHCKNYCGLYYNMLQVFFSRKKVRQALQNSSAIGAESKWKYEGVLRATDELIGQDSGGS